jgi:hypothetical protein
LFFAQMKRIRVMGRGIPSEGLHVASRFADYRPGVILSSGDGTMRCFVHHDADAVGICKCCAKGTCAACAIVVTNGLACSEVCRPVAEDIAQLQLVTLRNQGIYRSQRLVQPVMAALFMVTGVSMIYSYPSWSLGWIFSAAGVVTGLALIVSSRRRRAV